MPDIQEVELIIGSRDESQVSAIEKGLEGVEVTRGRDARLVDPVTVLAVAAGVAKLVDALLALKKRMAQRKDSPVVEIKTEDGRSITLTDATPALLTALLSATKGA
jgi:hypothetical protein